MRYFVLQPSRKAPCRMNVFMLFTEQSEALVAKYNQVCMWPQFWTSGHHKMKKRLRGQLRVRISPQSTFPLAMNCAKAHNFPKEAAYADFTTCSPQG